MSFILHVCLCVWSSLLDHERDVLVQVAAVELHQVDQDMQEVSSQAHVHPEQHKPCWDKDSSLDHPLHVFHHSNQTHKALLLLLLLLLLM